jgi:hypothetical protein
MKHIAWAIALMSSTVMAAPLTVTLNLSGIDSSELKAPTANFASTNPICREIVVIPMPGSGPKRRSLEGTINRVSKSKVVLTIPTELDNSLCKYKLDYVHLSLGKRLEAISLETSTFEAKERNILNTKTIFTAECGKNICRVLKEGSQIGYGNGNLATFHLDPKKLNTAKGPEAVINVVFN